MSDPVIKQESWRSGIDLTDTSHIEEILDLFDFRVVNKHELLVPKSCNHSFCPKDCNQNGLMEQAENFSRLVTIGNQNIDVLLEKDKKIAELEQQLQSEQILKAAAEYKLGKMLKYGTLIHEVYGKLIQNLFSAMTKNSLSESTTLSLGPFRSIAERNRFLDELNQLKSFYATVVDQRFFVQVVASVRWVSMMLENLVLNSNCQQNNLNPVVLPNPSGRDILEEQIAQKLSELESASNSSAVANPVPDSSTGAGENSERGSILAELLTATTSLSSPDAAPEHGFHKRDRMFFNCLCGQTFDSYQKLTNHALSHQKPESSKRKRKEKNVLKCSQCRMMFNGRNEYMIHYQNVHESACAEDALTSFVTSTRTHLPATTAVAPNDNPNDISDLIIIVAQNN